MAEKRMGAAESLGHVKGGRARQDAMRRQNRLCRIGNRFQRERMRKRLERGVIFEHKVGAFIGLHEDEDWRSRRGRRGAVEREPVRIREARGMAMPIAECGQVIAFSGHQRDRLGPIESPLRHELKV
jgi:hypothetical protein